MHLFNIRKKESWTGWEEPHILALPLPQPVINMGESHCLGDPESLLYKIRRPMYLAFEILLSNRV